MLCSGRYSRVCRYDSEHATSSSHSLNGRTRHRKKNSLFLIGALIIGIIIVSALSGYILKKALENVYTEMFILVKCPSHLTPRYPIILFQTKMYQIFSFFLKVRFLRVLSAFKKVHFLLFYVESRLSSLRKDVKGIPCVTYFMDLMQKFAH